VCVCVCVRAVCNIRSRQRSSRCITFLLQCTTGCSAGSWSARNCPSSSDWPTKMTVYWDVTPCSWVDSYWHLGRPCCLTDKASSVSSETSAPNRILQWPTLPTLRTAKQACSFPFPDPFTRPAERNESAAARSPRGTGGGGGENVASTNFLLHSTYSTVLHEVLNRPPYSSSSGTHSRTPFVIPRTSCRDR
jgi:hypothetical protein